MSTNLFELPAIYLPGVDNLVADALPRWDESTVYIPSTPLLRILYDEVCIGDDIFGFLTIYDITVLLCFVLRFFCIYDLHLGLDTCLDSLPFFPSFRVSCFPTSLTPSS